MNDHSLEICEFEDEPVELTRFLDDDTAGLLPPCPHPLRHPLRAIGWVVQAAFGLASLVLLLAIVAAIPLVNFLALGYLLEAQGRVARTGKLRHAFPLLDLAPRLGSIALGIWLWTIPLRLLAGAAADARLIDPAGRAAGNLHTLTLTAAVLIAVHLCLALARGGGFWCFFRPMKNVLWLVRRLRRREYWETAECDVRTFLIGLRLKHHFSLGLRGFAGAFLWLAVPSALFAALRDTEHGGQVLVTVLGGMLLVLVFAWLPFLQARFAAENRFGAMFELGVVRNLFCRAPLVWLAAVFLVSLSSLPLYLFKIVSPPQDAMWGLTVVFIASIYPAKIAVGWAYHRAIRRERSVWFGFRWTSRVLIVALLVGYVFLLFFTQYLGEHGKGVLFEHHVFLLPVPFPGLR